MNVILKTVLDLMEKSKKMITILTVRNIEKIPSTFIKWYSKNVCVLEILGDYDGSDNEYYDDNEYDNSDSKGFGADNQKHWERDVQPDVSNIKAEKV